MMHTALQIPRIGPPSVVPRSFTVVDASEPFTAQAALTLMDAGIIPVDLRLGGQRSPERVLQAGLVNWLERQQAGMRVIRFGLQLGLVDPSIRREKRPEYFNLRLVTHDGYWQPALIIGPAVKRIEADHAGLGETLMYWLNQAHRLIPIYTPNDALGMASFVYWSGCENEAEWREMMLHDGEDPGDFEIVTRAQFDKAIPLWASKPKQRITPENLRGIDGNASWSKSRTRRVATLLSRLADWHADKTQWPDPLPIPDDLVILRAATLMWSDRDPMLRIADDFGNLAMEHGEYCEHFSEANFIAAHARTRAAERQEITDAWRDHFAHLAKVIHIMRIVDQLIGELVPAKQIEGLHG